MSRLRMTAFHELLGVTLCLVGAGAAFLAAPSAAQTCGDSGCRIQITVTSSQPSVQVGDRLVFTLTTQNTGTMALERVSLWARPGNDVRPESAACAAENSRWSSSTSRHWRLDVGALGPGEKRTARFCVEVEDSPDCSTSQHFATYGTRVSGTTSALFGDETVARVPRASCTAPCAASGEGGAACCVAEAIQCLFHPSDPLCGGSISSAVGAGLRRLTSGAVAAGTRYFGPVADIGRLYLLRDVLAATPGGRGAIALYTAHQLELKRLLLADPALRERAIDVLTAWRPVIDGAIVPSGAATAITSGQVTELESFLGELRLVASPSLRAAIDRESQALDLDALVGRSSAEAVQLLNKLTCIPGPTTLCLSGGRVRIDTEWEVGDGHRGNGRAVALTGDTGTFWFFAAANVETIVKVVDACTFNDRRWVFVAGLTDVGVVTTVTDTATGAVKTYENPVGRTFAPVQDTSAFDCTP